MPFLSLWRTEEWGWNLRKFQLIEQTLSIEGLAKTPYSWIKFKELLKQERGIFREDLAQHFVLG